MKQREFKIDMSLLIDDERKCAEFFKHKAQQNKNNVFGMIFRKFGHSINASLAKMIFKQMAESCALCARLPKCVKEKGINANGARCEDYIFNENA